MIIENTISAHLFCLMNLNNEIDKKKKNYKVYNKAVPLFHKNTKLKALLTISPNTFNVCQLDEAILTITRRKI